jgi:hypothetical protein
MELEMDLGLGLDLDLDHQFHILTTRKAPSLQQLTSKRPALQKKNAQGI